MGIVINKETKRAAGADEANTVRETGPDSLCHLQYRKELLHVRPVLA